MTNLGDLLEKSGLRVPVAKVVTSVIKASCRNYNIYGKCMEGLEEEGLEDCFYAYHVKKSEIRCKHQNKELKKYGQQNKEVNKEARSYV